MMMKPVSLLQQRRYFRIRCYVSYRSARTNNHNLYGHSGWRTCCEKNIICVHKGEKGRKAAVYYKRKDGSEVVKAEETDDRKMRLVMLLQRGHKERVSQRETHAQGALD